MSTRTHTCVFFDEAETTLVCSCGVHAVLVLDERGQEMLSVVEPADGRHPHGTDASCEARHALAATA